MLIPEMWIDFGVWVVKTWRRITCVHDWKYVHASYRTFGSCSDFEECRKCGKTK